MSDKEWYELMHHQAKARWLGEKDKPTTDTDKELVARLRENSSEFSMMWDAADAIERLSAKVAELKRKVEYPCSPICAGYLRAEAAEAEVKRLKGAITEAINSEQDRMQDGCQCKDCTVTLKSIGDGLRSALHPGGQSE